MFWCLNFAEYKVKSSNYERSTSNVNLVVCNEEYTKKEPKDHDHKNIQRFLSECEVMFILRHPCVSCIIVVNNDHLPSIILSLESAIAKKKLEQHKKCRITVDNEWFDTFHRNFMHGDLKPSNILISKGKQGWISDFKKVSEHSHSWHQNFLLKMKNMEIHIKQTRLMFIQSKSFLFASLQEVIQSLI